MAVSSHDLAEGVRVYQCTTDAEFEDLTNKGCITYHVDEGMLAERFPEVFTLEFRELLLQLKTQLPSVRVVSVRRAS